VAAGIDAAKSTFSVCGVERRRNIVLERTMNRATRPGAAPSGAYCC
jgi:hypothetical protein